jgi:hypothetical protein
LIVTPNLAVVVEIEDLDATAGVRPVSGRHHLPGERDEALEKAVQGTVRGEPVLASRDEHLVGSRHPGFERGVAVHLKGRRPELQLGGGIAGRRRRVGESERHRTPTDCG